MANKNNDDFSAAMPDIITDLQMMHEQYVHNTKDRATLKSLCKFFAFESFEERYKRMLDRIRNRSPNDWI